MKSSDIRLGAVIFDRDSAMLSGAGGEGPKLRHQARQVLLKLSETPGEVVARQALFDAVWEGAHVSDDSLAQCIAEIRQAIGDGEKTILETIPRKGYRLNPSAAPARRAFRPSRRMWLAAAAVIAVAAAILGALLVRAPVDRAPPVIAVLPFDDDSPPGDRGALGASLAENILADLARYSGLKVIARGSSFRFGDGSIGIREIGETLGADLVLEGSKFLDGRTLRVTARLVDAESETEIWSDRIDTDLSAFFQVSDQISRRVAYAVEAVVADVQAREVSADAADAYFLNLKARQIVGAGLSPDNVAAAVAASRVAVEQYPDETWGHLSLAFALRLQHRFGWAENPDASIAEALSHAETAVKLAPDNHLAYTAMGRVLMRTGNSLAAVEAFDQAMVLNPSAADTLNAQAQAYLYLGENERSFEALARSAEIDPLPERVRAWALAWTAWQARDCTAARQYFAQMPAPPAAARKLEAAILACLGEDEAASAALERFLPGNPGWTQADERALFEGIWIAEGALDRWLEDLAAAGLPSG